MYDGRAYAWMAHSSDGCKIVRVLTMTVLPLRKRRALALRSHTLGSLEKLTIALESTMHSPRSDRAFGGGQIDMDRLWSTLSSPTAYRRTRHSTSTSCNCAPY